MWLSDRAPTDEHVYHRKLPSGGYVAIAAQEVRPLFAAPKVRGQLLVERRREVRNPDDRPPIIAVAERDNVQEILDALLPMAESDEMLSRTLEWRATVPITKRRGLPES